MRGRLERTGLEAASLLFIVPSEYKKLELVQMHAKSVEVGKVSGFKAVKWT